MSSRRLLSKVNVMDLAVGVIIGAAFQGIVTSFTENFHQPDNRLYRRC